MLIREHNLETNTIIDREATLEELAKFEAEQATEAARLEAEQAKAANRAALLERLGITDEEAKLLLL